MKDLKRLTWVFVGIVGMFIGLTGRLVEYQLDGLAIVPVELEERLTIGIGGVIFFAVGMLLFLQGRAGHESKRP